MDIAALSVLLNQVHVKQQANLSVMKMAMNTREIQAADMLNMLEESVEMPNVDYPYLGRTIDFRKIR